jgi:hypothetical protein
LGTKTSDAAEPLSTLPSCKISVAIDHSKASVTKESQTALRRLVSLAGSLALLIIFILIVSAFLLGLKAL